MSDAFVRDKIAFIMQVTYDTTLPSGAARVANLIADHVSREFGYAWPAIGTIASRLGVTENTVRKALRALVAAGHLLVETGGGRGTANRYRWNVATAEDRAADDHASAQTGQSTPDKPCKNSKGLGPKPCKELHPSSDETLQIRIEKPYRNLNPTPLKETIDREEDTPSFPHFDFEEAIDRSVDILEPVIASEIVVAADRFDEFWTAYPRRIAKGSARRAFKAAVRRGADPDLIIAGARRFAAERAGHDDRFTPYPATWISAERWDDPPLASVPTYVDPYRDGGEPRSGGYGRRPITATEMAMEHVARRRAMQEVYQ